MSKIAVIATGGKQYKVKVGDKIKIEKLLVEPEAMVKFETLMVADGDELNLGAPKLGELVEGKVIETAQAKKIHVIKFKNKTRYRKNVGHRQILTKVEITKIS